MIIIKKEEEIELLRESGILVSKTLAIVGKNIKPGITTNELDKIAEEYIRDHGGIPGFLGYENYPKTLCTSVNYQVVHGIPSSMRLNNGDIVSVDCGVILNGYYGDSAYTFEVGEVNKDVKKLLKVTRESLFKGIDLAIDGKRIGDLGYAIQSYCENEGFSIVRELVGHGIGKRLHEPPEVPNYGKKGQGTKLKEGMVICIEPMINMGRKEIVQESDGWTVLAADRKFSAHYELTVAIRKEKPDVLSTFDYIEQNIN